MAESIAYDEAMTVDLLRAANSAGNANLSQIATVHEALARLYCTGASDRGSRGRATPSADQASRLQP